MTFATLALIAGIWLAASCIGGLLIAACIRCDDDEV